MKSVEKLRIITVFAIFIVELQMSQETQNYLTESFFIENGDSPSLRPAKARAIIDAYASGRTRDEIQKQLRDEIPAGQTERAHWVTGERLLKVFREEIESNWQFRKRMDEYKESVEALSAFDGSRLRRLLKETIFQRRQERLVAHLAAKLDGPAARVR